jgi:cytochrome c-type biogenesis protein CcmH
MPRITRLMIGYVFAVVVTAISWASTGAYAVEPSERLADPALEARARALSAELRCLVCQNQSIDDSNAPLARDLRMLVREQLKSGASDAQVMTFIVARYGEFVLLRPQFGRHTVVLWLAPVLVLGIAGALWHRQRRQISTTPPRTELPLNSEEQRRLNEIMSRTPDA